jgi:hypothetical protein
MVVALSLELPRRDPAPKAERILMVDVAATQARAKGVAPSTNREGAQTEAAMTKIPSALPSTTQAKEKVVCQRLPKFSRP